MESMTFGEIFSSIQAHRESQRRSAQTLAFVAFQLAQLIAQAVLSGKLPEIYDVFPFWNEQEVNQWKVEKIRQKMQNYVAKGRNVTNHRSV